MCYHLCFTCLLSPHFSPLFLTKSVFTDIYVTACEFKRVLWRVPLQCFCLHCLLVLQTQSCTDWFNKVYNTVTSMATMKMVYIARGHLKHISSRTQSSNDELYFRASQLYSHHNHHHYIQPVRGVVIRSTAAAAACCHYSMLLVCISIIV